MRFYNRVDELQAVKSVLDQGTRGLRWCTYLTCLGCLCETSGMLLNRGSGGLSLGLGVRLSGRLVVEGAVSKGLGVWVAYTIDISRSGHDCV